jgi:hypothetical protein
MNDNHLNPPEPCSVCDMYYAYKGGLCWECYHSDKEDREYDKHQEKMDRDERAMKGE